MGWVGCVEAKGFFTCLCLVWVQQMKSSPSHSDIEGVDAVEKFKCVLFFAWNGDIFHTIAKVVVTHRGLHSKNTRANGFSVSMVCAIHTVECSYTTMCTM